MRPLSIIWFTRIQFSILSLGLLNLVLTWNQQLAIAATIGRGPGWLLGKLVLTAGWFLLLMWLIAYRGSNVAKWVYVAMFCLGFPFLVVTWKLLAQNGPLSLAITMVQTVLQLISVWMLFRRDARDWLAKRPSVDPEIFR
jgi:hypothetical protein